MTDAAQQDLIVRFRKWVVWAIVFGALLYVGGSVWAGLGEVSEQLQSFSWSIYVVVLLLTLVNYGLRFVKWHYLLRLLRVEISWRQDLTIFVAGLSMVISPGKAGELLKPYLVSRQSRVPMATTLPALVAERLTDGIAMVLLAAISVGTYAADQAWVLWVLGGIAAAGLAVLAHEGVSLRLLGILERLPLVGRWGHKLEELYRAMRTCVSPLPLLLTTFLSVIAWGAECLGYLLVFRRGRRRQARRTRGRGRGPGRWRHRRAVDPRAGRRGRRPARPSGDPLVRGLARRLRPAPLRGSPARRCAPSGVRDRGRDLDPLDAGPR